MNEGFVSTDLGLKGDPVIAESVIVGRDIEIAKYLDARIHLCHMSTKRSLELIRFAKSQGVKVTAEACPHHFALTDEAVRSFDTSTKMNPPLRSQEDVIASSPITRRIRWRIKKWAMIRLPSGSSDWKRRWV